MYTKILATHEQIDDAPHALDKAAVLATALRAELFVLSILSPGPGTVLNLDHRSPDDLVGSPAFNELHARAQAWARGQTVHPRLETRVGDPVHLIEHYAKEIR